MDYDNLQFTDQDSENPNNLPQVRKSQSSNLKPGLSDFNFLICTLDGLPLTFRTLESNREPAKQISSFRI